MNAPWFGLAAPGAVADLERPAIPAHYGDPAGEGRALEVGAALVDLGDMNVVRVSGPDRLKWLTTLSSQVGTGLGPASGADDSPEQIYQHSREALLMDHNGHIQHVFGWIDDGQASYLFTAANRGEALVEFLSAMVFASRVEVGIETGRGRVCGLAANGPVAAAVRSSGALLWRDPWPGIAPGGTKYADYQGRLSPVVPLALALLPKDFPIPQLGEPLSAADGALVREVRAAGLAAWQAQRIVNWRPTAEDLDERSLPHEYDWLRTAVHLDKGCYCGQETVARIINLGRPPRRLVQLDFDGDGQLPEAGDEVLVRAGEREKVIGRICAIGRHYQDGVIALALVSRAFPAGEVIVNGAPVSLTEIVSGDGKAAASPQVRPGSGLKRLPTRRA